MSDDWYKRDVRKAIAGMACLTPEERGCYNTLIDHQYLMNRALHDDDRYLAGLMNCDIRVWRRIRQNLIAKGRLQVTCDGRIEDIRASYELASRQAQRSQRVASGQLGGIASGESRKNNGLGEACASGPLNQIRVDKSRVEEKRRDKIRVEEIRDDFSSEFDEFWNWYPRKKGKGAARASFLKTLSTTSGSEVVAGARKFAIECHGKDEQYIPHPATWLNQERWLDTPEKTIDDRARDEWSEVLEARDGDDRRETSGRIVGKVVPLLSKQVKN